MSETQLVDPDLTTVTQVLAQAAVRFGDADALVSDETTLSYGQWWRDAGGVSSELKRMGVMRGDVVALILPSSIVYAVSYVAALRLGAVTSGINPRMGPREVASILAILEPKAIIVDHDSRQLVPPELQSIAIDDTELAEHSRDEPADVVDADPQDPTAIVWTSGTTGTLKGAWFDHRALKAVASATGELTHAYDRRLLPLPFAHAGFMTKIWETAAYGNAIILVNARFTADDMLRVLRTERITVAAGVPTQWERLLALVEGDAGSLPHLRIAAVSTAPASAELVEAIREALGVTVLVRYASTETPMGTGTLTGDPDEVVSRTVGRAHHGVELRIVDESDRELPPGDVGAVQLRSAAQMRGYWRNPELTAQAMTVDGWVRTGDLGYLRDGTNLVLAGRRSDMYIRGGYNVYPLEVENVLALHPDVREAAVVGVPAPDIGEKGVAIVVPVDSARPPTREELREFVRHHISDYKRPDEVVYVDQLPRTPMLKIARSQLASLIAQQSTQPAD